MISRDDLPETPDWVPEPRLCELDLAAANARRWRDTLAAIADPEHHIVRGSE